VHLTKILTNTYLKAVVYSSSYMK